MYEARGGVMHRDPAIATRVPGILERLINKAEVIRVTSSWY